MNINAVDRSRNVALEWPYEALVNSASVVSIQALFADGVSHSEEGILGRNAYIESKRFLSTAPFIQRMCRAPKISADFGHPTVANPAKDCTFLQAHIDNKLAYSLQRYKLIIESGLRRHGIASMYAAYFLCMI